MDGKTDTTVRMTDRLSVAVNTVSQLDRYRSKKQFVEQAVDQHSKHIASLITGYQSLKNFTIRVDSDVTWASITQPDTELDSKFKPGSGLSSIVNLELRTDTEQTVNSIANSTTMSRSGVIRVCTIKHCYEHASQFNEATSMELSDRWLSIKLELKHMCEKLIMELYYELDSERVNAKLQSDMERKNIHHLGSHYKQFKDTKGHEVMTQNHYGKRLTRTLNRVLDCMGEF